MNMSKLSVTSREVLIAELHDLILKARDIAKQRIIDIEQGFWEKKLKEYNDAGAKRRFRKRQYTMEQVKQYELEMHRFGLLTYVFKTSRIKEDVGRLSVLERLCTDAFSGKTIQLSADDNNLISYYIEKRFVKHDS